MRAHRRKKRPRTVLHLPVRIEELGRLAARLNSFEAGDDMRDGLPLNARPGERLLRFLSPDGVPGPLAETLLDVLARLAGEEIRAYLRRCEVCREWMVARSRKGRRCGPQCASRVWTRSYRRHRRAAQNVHASTPESRSRRKEAPTRRTRGKDAKRMPGT
jgi:hypothetical protein